MRKGAGGAVTNREVLLGLSDRKLARQIVRFGLECKGCPAERECGADGTLPCEEQIAAWLAREYIRKEERYGEI